MPQFTFAPIGWTREAAQQMAEREGLRPGDDHWSVVGALQEYYARNPEGTRRVQGMHDALEEKFHHKGGLKYLYGLFPGGPVAQGCRLAGLKPPSGSLDKGFGSAA